MNFFATENQTYRELSSESNYYLLVTRIIKVSANSQKYLSLLSVIK